MQTFEGSFPLTQTLATLLGVSLAVLQAKLKEFTPANATLSDEQKNNLWATALALWAFENKFAVERDVWELVAEKSKAWLIAFDKEDVKTMEKFAQEVLKN